MATASMTMGGPTRRGDLAATLLLAWPMILTNLAQTAMTATDVMMMGRLGPEALAAGTLGSNFYYAPMMFGLGLLLAVSPMVATELGRRSSSVRDVRRTVRQGFWLATIVALPLWVLMWNGEAIMLAMGQEPGLAAMAGAYLRTLQWALLPFYGFIVLRSYVSALERPAWALGVMVFAVAFNVFANWCLMFGNLGFPALGIVGSGIATTASCIVMFASLALVVSLDRRFRRYRLFGRFWRSDWPRLAEMTRLGLPIAFILLFEVGLFSAAAFVMGLIDATALAAHAIAMQIASLSFMVPLGLGQAATVRVGRAAGAGDRDAVRRAGWTAFALGVGFMACIALVMLFAPRLLISAFVDISDPINAAVVDTAVIFLAIAALFQIVDGAQAVGAGMLRGLQDTGVPMILAAIGYWGVGMPLGLVLAFWAGMGGAGVWLGFSAGLAVVALLLVTRWMRRDRLPMFQARSPSTSSI